MGCWSQPLDSDTAIHAQPQFSWGPSLCRGLNITFGAQAPTNKVARADSCIFDSTVIAYISYHSYHSLHYIYRCRPQPVTRKTIIISLPRLTISVTLHNQSHIELYTWYSILQTHIIHPISDYHYRFRSSSAAYPTSILASFTTIIQHSLFTCMQTKPFKLNDTSLEIKVGANSLNIARTHLDLVLHFFLPQSYRPNSRICQHIPNTDYFPAKFVAVPQISHDILPCAPCTVTVSHMLQYLPVIQPLQVSV